jgi:hypothetical protein
MRDMLHPSDRAVDLFEYEDSPGRRRRMMMDEMALG